MALRLLGMGDNVVDQYLDTEMGYPGGQALNFSVYSRMLGADAAYLGVFGKDQNGDFVREVASGLSVSLDRCPVRAGENGFARITHENGDRVFLSSNRGGISKTEPLCLTNEDLDYIRGFDHVHTSTNGRIDRELPKLRDIGMSVSYDFSNKLSEELLRPICPMITYAVLSCGHLSLPDTEAIIERVHGWGAAYAVATRGENGSFFSDGSRLWFYPAAPADVRDTLGAGDAYLAAFLVSYLEALKERGTRDTGEDEISREVQRAMESGARFAARIIGIEGAFGYGRPLRELNAD